MCVCVRERAYRFSFCLCIFTVSSSYPLTGIAADKRLLKDVTFFSCTRFIYILLSAFLHSIYQCWSPFHKLSHCVCLPVRLRYDNTLFIPEGHADGCWCPPSDQCRLLSVDNVGAAHRWKCDSRVSQIMLPRKLNSTSNWRLSVCPSRRIFLSLLIFLLLPSDAAQNELLFYL